MRTLGIIGQGNFGKFTAQEMDGLFKIETYDITDPISQFERVANCDYVVLAIPLSSYEDVLGKLVKVISEDTVVVDVCSVKIKPLDLIRTYLPNHEVLSVHPLFGPATAPNGIEGQKIIIIRDTGSFETHADAQKFYQKLKLEVIQMDAERHDRMMAELHAITYFVAESLSDFGVAERPISLPSYDRLVSLVNLSGTHSPDLLDTIERGNPFAAEMRTKLMQSFIKTDKKYTE